MLLSILGKVMAVLVAGGGGFATYYFVSKNKINNPSTKIDLEKRIFEEICSKPFVMKTTNGIKINFNSEQEGWDFLRDHYQGQGTVEKCLNYRESK